MDNLFHSGYLASLEQGLSVEIQRLTTYLDTALDVRRRVFLTSLDRLTHPRRVYDTDPDEIKTLLTKTIFGKLCLDAAP